MSEARRLELAALDRLFEVLRSKGYRIIGPTVRDGAILYDDIHSSTDLPRGWTEEQEAGHYRLRRRSDDAHFGFTVGPTSWRRFLDPPEEVLWTAEITAEGSWQTRPSPVSEAPLAFVGVRSCDLHAVAVQDRVFAREDGSPGYTRRRASALWIAVACGESAATCFCASTGTGPRPDVGYDLALTEVLEEGGAWFLAESGSPRGRELLERLPGRRVDVEEREKGEDIPRCAAEQQVRRLDRESARGLTSVLEHPHWDVVAERCLSCANCTLVCPTCFCGSVQDTSDLSGERIERTRRWDSCFTEDHSFIHGGSVRPTIRSRYRQWLTHKLATWWDQFDTSGCIGCGRCITWCPTGIDLTEEVPRLLSSSSEGEDE
ncbi:MAG: 4Fe-4S dicluster domain-containing protein [Planctomycetota bacterium]